MNNGDILRAELEQSRKTVRRQQNTMIGLASFIGALILRNGDLADFVPDAELAAARAEGSHSFRAATARRRKDPESNGDADEPEEVSGLKFAFVPHQEQPKVILPNASNLNS